jgi:hypothetical protein
LLDIALSAAKALFRILVAARLALIEINLLVHFEFQDVCFSIMAPVSFFKDRVRSKSDGFFI